MALITSPAARLLVIVLLGASMIGCASVKMPPPSPTPTTIEKLRVSDLPSSKVGEFGLAPGVNPSLDTSLSGLRGSTLQASNGSFSQHLREVIIAELKAAGLYDPESQIQIEGQLVESQVDAAIKTGTAKLAANFTVDKADNRVYQKTLAVDSQWPSSFVGAIALPEAIHQYSALYKALAAKLFDDEEFRAALAR